MEIPMEIPFFNYKWAIFQGYVSQRVSSLLIISDPQGVDWSGCRAYVIAHLLDPRRVGW
jgi:hypothetical protein